LKHTWWRRYPKRLQQSSKLELLNLNLRLRKRRAPSTQQNKLNEKGGAKMSRESKVKVALTVGPRKRLRCSKKGDDH
jgi:hypothetical protein